MAPSARKKGAHSDGLKRGNMLHANPERKGRFTEKKRSKLRFQRCQACQAGVGEPRKKRGTVRNRIKGKRGNSQTDIKKKTLGKGAVGRASGKNWNLLRNVASGRRASLTRNSANLVGKGRAYRRGNSLPEKRKCPNYLGRFLLHRGGETSVSAGEKTRAGKGKGCKTRKGVVFLWTGGVGRMRA